MESDLILQNNIKNGFNYSFKKILVFFVISKVAHSIFLSLKNSSKEFDWLFNMEYMQMFAFYIL